jgi:hypothetical protein
MRFISTTVLLFLAPMLCLAQESPWPKSVPFPKDMETYKRAENTQSIGKNVNTPFIKVVSRLGLDKKWHQSGGMAEIKDFHSDIYRDTKIKPRIFQGVINVGNGYFWQPNGRFDLTKTDKPITQPEVGWKREYPNGARFMDVLSNTKLKKVFEIRKLEKHEGSWFIFADYEDPSARPKGYNGKIGVSCGSCHAEAGFGGYNVGLVPGGDMVLSDPFPAIK